MNKSTYINQLNEELQVKIKNVLTSVLDCVEDIENAMDSRISDIEELISFEQIKNL